MKKMLLAAACGLLCSSSVMAQGWGTVSGQIVVNGATPEPILLHAKGAAIKDAEVCAAVDTFSEEVIVDKDTKGLANVFVYLARAKKIHPDYEKPQDVKVIFDQKGCQFLPHSLFVRAGQTVEVISSDPIAHNTHTYPLRNQAVNVLIAPNTPKGSGVDVSCNVAERMPHQVKCDYHPWMMAYWLVLDHPYAAISGKDGKFTIENLPAGDHELVIWHEKIGYIDRKFSVSVKDGQETSVKPVSVDVAKLK